ncbi:MAG: WD40/YVTN/BNR-like repeat-containing protein [Bacteroidota bacterium]
MKQSVLLLLSIIIFMSGCKNNPSDQETANKLPKTLLWLYPDSTLAPGHSKQHIYWSATDPDGLIKGYLFASGKLGLNPRRLVFSDSIAWRWITTQDSVIAFPLRTKRDTFQICVRSVDNAYPRGITDGAVIRNIASANPYWDKNNNGIYDSSDVYLPSFINSIDPQGGILSFPVANQPPSVAFAPNPNNPTVNMQQPDTTFTTASFAWSATDPDGDGTVVQFEIALNDTNDISRLLVIPASSIAISPAAMSLPALPNNDPYFLVSLMVPRQRSDGLIGVQEVTTDVWSGMFSTVRRNIGQLGHLKLNSLNTFYVRARDIADSASNFIRMPGDTSHTWYVKNPRGHVLIVDDYSLSDKDSALTFYRSLLPAVGYPDFEIMNIDRGVTVADKLSQTLGKMVPNLLDPAMNATLQLFDAVVWYSDVYPSLVAAQFPLYQYINDPVHHGKVIFSTMFQYSIDPRGALTDFAPLDSISNVDLTNSRLLPTAGDTHIPKGYALIPNEAGLPQLVFNSPSRGNLYSVYLRQIYKRADGEYIYKIQADTSRPSGSNGHIGPPSYSTPITINDLSGLSVVPGGKAWACGANGIIVHSDDGGTSWQMQTSGTTNTLKSIQFIDQMNGWAVGLGGTLLHTTNGGNSWDQLINITFEDLYCIYFQSPSLGFACGTTGEMLRTINGGASWRTISDSTSVTLYGVSFSDAPTGVAVGDAGTILHTTNGGVNWSPASQRMTAAPLNGCAFSNGLNCTAVGMGGIILNSSDGGINWLPASQAPSQDLYSVLYRDQNTGWISGMNGSVYETVDGGVTWNIDSTRVEQNISPGQTVGAAQTLLSIRFFDARNALAVGTGGIILQTNTGGSTWTLQPKNDFDVAIIDGPGSDGKNSIVFFSVPLHLLNGNPQTFQVITPAMKQLFQFVFHDKFGL